MPDYIKSLVHVYLSCPHCGWSLGQPGMGGGGFPDKRYKKEINGFIARIYRASETSITMECKNCKMKFNVTWRNFRKLFENLIVNTNEERHREHYKNYIEILDRLVDTANVMRKAPANRLALPKS